MAEIVYSEGLQLVLEYVRSTVPSKGMITAEGFLAAFCDLYRKETDISKKDEFKEAAALIFTKLMNLTALRGALVFHITTSDEETLSREKIYFERLSEIAKRKAIESGSGKVGLEIMISTLLLHSTDCITEAMEKARMEDPATEDDTDNSEGIENRRKELSALTAKAKRIRESLERVVVGQNKAIDVLCGGFFRSELIAMTEENREKPRATFLFAGPPGVGKTHLARSAARVLGEIPFCRFDMSEYADKESSIEFCGSDKVYKNGKPGNVTDFVAKNPRCILLFDEIEKAHITVIHLFLQILDAGIVRDNHTDEEVSFKDAIIIFTTNAGKQLYESSESGDFSVLSRKVILKALLRDVDPHTGVPYFPSAICSRFASGNVVMFNRMEAHDLAEIAKRELECRCREFSERLGISVEVDKNVYTALLLSEGASIDARTAAARARAFFDNEIFELFRLTDGEAVESSVEDIAKIKIGVDLSESDRETAALFESCDAVDVLIFSPGITEDICKKLAGIANVHIARTADNAMEKLFIGDIGAAFIDMSGEANEKNSRLLNIEDRRSEARDLFKRIRAEYPSLPVYLTQNGDFRFTPEERLSFMRQGVRSIISPDGDEESFKKEISDICEMIHQQKSMVNLARANKLITYETSQYLSEDGECANITLFDLKLSVAIDAEDSENILSRVSVPNVCFDDIIGADSAKDELSYFVNYLKEPKKYIKKGVGCPKGVLLYGPPGTGKTMLAKAMAKEAGVTFILAEGNEFLKKYLGEGSEKVHELFRIARKYAPSVLFIDEIDAIAAARTGNQGERGGEETLTAFLTEMDGFVNDTSKPVFVLAATNFDIAPESPKAIDEALLRRFDRRIYIDLPGKESRLRFIKRKMAASGRFDISADELESIAVRSTGMSLSQLDGIFEAALRAAVRAGSDVVCDELLDDSFETFTGGDRKSWDADQLRRTALHESGHAVVCAESGRIPSYLTVVSRGNRGGYMRFDDGEDKAVYTKNELLGRIRTALGGRACEIVYFGEEDGLSTGASGDLAMASAVARDMLCNLGMYESFGICALSEAEKNGELVREAVNKILEDELSAAIDIINKNKSTVDKLVNQLVKKNHLTQKELYAIMGDRES